MTIKTILTAAAVAFASLTPAVAEGIMIKDAYARVASPVAKAGAAFMVIENHGPADRLISAKSEIAARTELHTHIEADNGVMQMVHIEEGFELPMHGTVALERGGKHVMFMGLNKGLHHGDTVSVTLVFENAGAQVVEVPVDLERKSSHGGHDGHGDHAHHNHD